MGRAQEGRSAGGPAPSHYGLIVQPAGDGGGPLAARRSAPPVRIKIRQGRAVAGDCGSRRMAAGPCRAAGRTGSRTAMALVAV